MDVVPGGIAVRALAGGTFTAYSCMKQPGPHTASGLTGNVAFAGFVAALPSPSSAWPHVMGDVTGEATSWMQLILVADNCFFYSSGNKVLKITNNHPPNKQHSRIPLRAKILMPLIFGTIIFMMANLSLVPWVNNMTAEPRTCTVESAVVDTSTGGSKSATKHEVVHIQTSECGEIRIYRLWGSFRSFQELADKLNENKDKALIFQIGRIQMNSGSTEANRVDF